MIPTLVLALAGACTSSGLPSQRGVIHYLQGPAGDTGDAGVAPDTGGGDDTGDTGQPGDTGRTEEVTVEAAPTGVCNVWTLTWTTRLPSDARVEYGEDGGFDHEATGTTSENGLEHTVTLAALAAGSRWTVRVAAAARGVTFTSEAIEIESDPVPSELPLFDLAVPPTDDVEGFTLTLASGAPAAVAVFDRQGRYVWWSEVGVPTGYRALYDPDTQTFSWPENSVDGAKLMRQRIDGEAEKVADLPRPHHDLTLDPAGGWYLIVYDEREMDVGDGTTEQVFGDQIIHVSADGSDSESVWSSWDEFPYEGHDSMDGPEGPEYPHTNSLTVLPDGDLLMSVYLADTLVRVDPTTGQSVWKMGGDRSDWELSEEDRFDRQHSPLVVDSGDTLLLFDNGIRDDYAEASRYALDSTEMKAERTWDFIDEGFQHVTKGSVVEAGDGFLVSWGNMGHFNEVDEDGEVRWQLDAEDGDVGYASHIEEFAGARR